MDQKSVKIEPLDDNQDAKPVLLHHWSRPATQSSNMWKEEVETDNSYGTAGEESTASAVLKVESITRYICGDKTDFFKDAIILGPIKEEAIEYDLKEEFTSAGQVGGPNNETSRNRLVPVALYTAQRQSANQSGTSGDCRDMSSVNPESGKRTPFPKTHTPLVMADSLSLKVEREIETHTPLPIGDSMSLKVEPDNETRTPLPIGDSMSLKAEPDNETRTPLPIGDSMSLKAEPDNETRTPLPIGDSMSLKAEPDNETRTPLPIGDSMSLKAESDNETRTPLPIGDSMSLKAEPDNETRTPLPIGDSMSLKAEPDNETRTHLPIGDSISLKAEPDNETRTPSPMVDSMSLKAEPVNETPSHLPMGGSISLKVEPDNETYTRLQLADPMSLKAEPDNEANTPLPMTDSISELEAEPENYTLSGDSSSPILESGNRPLLSMTTLIKKQPAYQTRTTGGRGDNLAVILASGTRTPSSVTDPMSLQPISASPMPEIRSSSVLRFGKHTVLTMTNSVQLQPRTIVCLVDDTAINLEAEISTQSPMVDSMSQNLKPTNPTVSGFSSSLIIESGLKTALPVSNSIRAQPSKPSGTIGYHGHSSATRPGISSPLSLPSMSRKAELTNQTESGVSTSSFVRSGTHTSLPMTGKGNPPNFKSYKRPVCETPQTPLVLERSESSAEIEKPYECCLCSFSADQYADILNHERIYSSEKLCHLSSSVCGTSKRIKVESPAVVDRKKPPYKCSRCPYVNLSKTKFTAHLRVHTGEKPYKCVSCSFATSEKASLVKHEGHHTGEKPYTCSFCSYGSDQSGGVRRHERIHRGEKPRCICSVCPVSLCPFRRR